MFCIYSLGGTFTNILRYWILNYDIALCGLFTWCVFDQFIFGTGSFFLVELLPSPPCHYFLLSLCKEILWGGANYNYDWANQKVN